MYFTASKLLEIFTLNLRCAWRNKDTSALGARGNRAYNMFSIIVGAVLIVIMSVSFWYLLPRNGQVHPLVNNWDGGSMITIVIMTGFTFGVVVILTGGFFG